MSARPGEQYTVLQGDTLEGIAAKAYGDSTLWPRIKQANQSQFKDDDPDTIFPGQKLNIPLEADLNKLKTQLAATRLSNKQIGELTILVNGLEIPWTAARVIRTIDTFADGWTATVPWPAPQPPDLPQPGSLAGCNRNRTRIRRPIYDLILSSPCPSFR